MKARNTPKRSAFSLDRYVLIGVLLVAAAVIAAPVYSIRSSASRARVSPAGATQSRVGSFASSNYPSLSSTSKGFRSLLPVQQPSPTPAEAIATYDSTCTTPKISFDLGETVCAIITGAPLAFNSRATRHVGWVSPYWSLVQAGDITTDPQQAFYVIPTSATQTFTDEGGGTVTVDNRGTWKVGIYSSSDGSLRTTADFVVHDPHTPDADLHASQASSFSESSVSAGSSSEFHIFVGNIGPDAAQTVVLTDDVPANTTLVAIVQSSGPTFSCSGPVAGGTGTITCTIASLASGDSASFDLAYNVNATTPPGTIISNTAAISSATNELTPDDNSSTATATVATASTGGGTGTCSVGCPENVTAVANTTQGTQNGAIVHFSPPSGNDECGVIVVDHCNDCFFPVGITTVTATSATTDTCSFTVQVTPTQGEAPVVTCPASQSGDANGSCSATFNVGTATATGGTNVTITASRSDGESIYTCDDFGNCTRNSSDAPFTYGVTTITWIASSHDRPGPYTATDTEEVHRTGSSTCTQTITVNDVTPPAISATNSSGSADASCQAPVPDYSNTVSDNCSSSITYTQTPAAGTLVGLGPHTVHIEANDNSSNNSGAGNTSSKDVTFTVNDTTPPTVSCPAPTSASADANCQAPVPDVASGASASDNCSGTITKTQSPAAGTMVGFGPHTITVTATDAAGNQGTCATTFTVNDTTPPTVSCPAPTSASADANCQAPVPDVRSGATTSDNCGSVTVTQSPAPGTMVGQGPHTITLTATDGSGNSTTCTTTFTVNDTTAPTINCPANMTANTLPGTCAAVVVTGTATASDNCDSHPTVTGTRSDGQPLTASYPKGTTTITWTATDASGNRSSCTQTITVVDNEPPRITLNGNTPSMWPPNHSYHTFTTADFVSSVSDNCDSLSVSDVYIAKVTSDEAENAAGSGNTLNDIVIGADCKSVQLRAERVNSGNGRVYTIYFKLKDSSGNFTIGTAKVYAPKNQGETPGDDGPHYTVTSGCP